MTAIRCAHCRDRHASVAAVRLCAEREKRIADRARTFARLPQDAPRVGSDYVQLARTEETQQERVARVAASSRYQRKQLEERNAANRAAARPATMNDHYAAAAAQDFTHHCEDFDGECCQPLTVAQMLDLAQNARDRA